MKILNIESSSKICSIAVADGEQLLYERTASDPNSHSSKLAVFVQDALQQVGSPLDAIAVSSGPGSYTGLRIGISLAKGLCFGLRIPLLSIPTLMSMAGKAIRLSPNDAALFCPMVDARRMEVYSQLYDARLHAISITRAEIITASSYAEYLAHQPIYFFGDGADKCQPVIRSPHAIFIDGIQPTASDMVALSAAKLAANQSEEIAYFEPFYLKEFEAKMNTGKALRVISPSKEFHC